MANYHLAVFDGQTFNDTKDLLYYDGQLVYAAYYNGQLVWKMSDSDYPYVWLFHAHGANAPYGSSIGDTFFGYWFKSAYSINNTVMRGYLANLTSVEFGNKLDDNSYMNVNVTTPYNSRTYGYYFPYISDDLQNIVIPNSIFSEAPIYAFLSNTDSTAYMWYEEDLLNKPHPNNMVGMFGGLYNLTFVNTSIFEWDMVYNASSMFYNDYNFSGAVPSMPNLREANSMFFNVGNVTSVVDAPNLINSAYMFYNVKNFTVGMSDDSFDHLFNSSMMFAGANWIPSTLNLPNIAICTSMFSSQSSGLNTDLTCYIGNNLTTASSMFSNVQSLQNVNVLFSNDPIRSSCAISSMFSTCNNLRDATISPIYTYVDAAYMFSHCPNLTNVYVDLNNFVNLAYMFQYDNLLTNVSDLEINYIATDTKNMFYCTNAFDRPVVFNINGITNFYNMNVNAYGMFSRANNFNQPVTFPPHIISLAYTFQGAIKMNSPVIILEGDSSNSDLTTVSMFAGCTNFNANVTFPTNRGINASSIFKGATNFNYPIDFPDKTYDLYCAFQSTKFNQDFYIPPNITNAFASWGWIFSGADMHGRTITVPNTIKDYCEYQINITSNNKTAEQYFLIQSGVAKYTYTNGWSNYNDCTVVWYNV